MRFLLPLFIFALACQKTQPQTDLPKEIQYEGTPESITVTGGTITEASGITYSNSMKGKFWVNEDSGNPPYLYLLGSDGAITDSLFVDGAANRDWEEVVLAQGPDANKSYLYVGDIGDNEAKYPGYTIYRFEEPGAGVKVVAQFDQIRFTYEDGGRDAEAFIVEQGTKDIYIISKREAKSRVYKLAYPQSVSANNIAEFVLELPYNNVVSAAASSDDMEVIIKTYTHVYHYQKQKGDSILAMLQAAAPTMLGYQLEPQGEALTFAHDGTGFYTLSEEAMGIVPKLYYYKKK